MAAFKNFLREDAGAVTIDWVALTAGILLLGIMVVYGIFNTGVSDLATVINNGLGSASVVTNADITEPAQSGFENGGAGAGGTEGTSTPAATDG